MIRATCPKCRRHIEVETPGLYTCRECRQVVRIEGRPPPMLPFPLSAVEPMESTTGKSAQSRLRYLAMYSRFDQAVR